MLVWNCVFEITLAACDKICWIFFLRTGIGLVRIKRPDSNMTAVYISEVINCSTNRKCWLPNWFQNTVNGFNQWQLKILRNQSSWCRYQIFSSDNKILWHLINMLRCSQIGSSSSISFSVVGGKSHRKYRDVANSWTNT